MGHDDLLVLPDHFNVFFALGAAASEIQADFQYCHCWTRNLIIGKSSRNCTNALFLSHRVEIELFSPCGQCFLRYRLLFIVP